MTIITITSAQKARIDAQYSMRTAEGELKTIGVAEVPESNPFDPDEINWYSKEIVNKLLNIGYHIKPFLADSINIRIQLDQSKQIEITEVSSYAGKVTIRLTGKRTAFNSWQAIAGLRVFLDPWKRGIVPLL